jgi:hypothetical protein
VLAVGRITDEAITHGSIIFESVAADVVVER